MRYTALVLIILMLMMLFLSACAPGSARFVEARPAGFFWGVWHGWIAPVSIIWHIFNPEIRLYEKNNNGGWYDFGFYIAVIGGFGGLALSRRRK